MLWPPGSRRNRCECGADRLPKAPVPVCDVRSAAKASERPPARAAGREVQAQKGEQQGDGYCEVDGPDQASPSQADAGLEPKPQRV